MSNWFKVFSHHLTVRSGNAVLVSLIVMASSITISQALAAVVSTEVRNVAILPAAERAYYQSESYVEQALWLRKHKADYDIQLAGLSGVQSQPFVCAANPCFTDTPAEPPGTFLKSFLATSRLQLPVKLTKDQATQVEIGQTNIGDTAEVFLDPVVGGEGFLGVEVSIVAFAKAGPFNALNLNADGTAPADPLATNTPVFIDKQVLTKDQLASGQAIKIGQTGGATGNGLNPLGERYPSLKTFTYRLRLRSLGNDSTVNPMVVSGGPRGSAPCCSLITSDYATYAVTSDGGGSAKAQRGVQVVTPVLPQIPGVFDFVLFAEYNLEKNAKGEGQGEPPSPPPPIGTWFAYGSQRYYCTKANDNNSDHCTYDGDHAEGRSFFVPSHQECRRRNGRRRCEREYEYRDDAIMQFITNSPASTPSPLPAGTYRVTLTYHARGQVNGYGFPVTLKFYSPGKSGVKSISLPIDNSPNSRRPRTIVIDNALLGSDVLTLTAPGNLTLGFQTINYSPFFTIDSVSVDPAR